MDYDIITEIELILQDYLEQGEKIQLYQVLMGIDSIYRLIPNIEELNEAAIGVGGIKITRSKESTEIHSIGQKQSDFFSTNDVDKAMINYNRLLK